MALNRTLAALILVLGLAAAAAFHSTGALGTEDALVAATLNEGVAGSPPLPLTSRMLAACVHAVRLIQPGAGVFHAMHFGGGLLLALAAVFSALVAYQGARGFPGAGFAAGLFVATALLFGADTARFAMSGGPVAPLLLLLAAAAAAWTRDKPWPFAGGLLLGLAIAEHPLCLFLVPGFVLVARGMCRRGARASDRWLLVRLAAGLVIGLAALALPLADSAGRPLLDHGDPETFPRALALWWGEPGAPFYELHSPLSWLGGFVSVWAALWKNVGPLGILMGLAGIPLFRRGHGQLAKPFLLGAGLPALAILLGDARDASLLRILLAWSFLFWTVPTWTALARASVGDEIAETSRRRTAWSLPALAILSALILLFANRGAIDQSAERGIAWARDSLEPLPENALLLTGNPVHLVLAVDGEREDVDVVYIEDASTVAARRGGREIQAPGSLPPGPLSPQALAEIVARNRESRSVFVDPAIFFQHQLRGALQGSRWKLLPLGLAFEFLPAGEKAPKDHSTRTSSIWTSYELEPDTPASPLRGGLTGNEFYARGLLQSAALHLDLDLLNDAEREFLLALSLGEANKTLAALGLARVLFERKNYGEAACTLQEHIRDDDPGAWNARRLLGNVLLRLGKDEEAAREFRHALQLVPDALPQEREALETLLRNLERRLPRRGTSP
jgi:hypothetical protein